MPTGIEVEDTVVKTEQLELIIAEQRKLQTPEELLEWVIKLYGEEFIKANAEIARLSSANDEMFLIKQKTVIANRGLVGDNNNLRADNAQLLHFTTQILNALPRNRDWLDPQLEALGRSLLPKPKIDPPKDEPDDFTVA